MAAAIVAMYAMLLGAEGAPLCVGGLLPPEGQRLTKTAAKGVELYSWKAGDGTTRFSFLWGTDRQKTEEQVKFPACAVDSLAELKAVVGKLAEGEQVFWMWDARECASCSYPSPDVVANVVAYGREAGITIEAKQRAVEQGHEPDNPQGVQR